MKTAGNGGSSLSNSPSSWNFTESFRESLHGLNYLPNILPEKNLFNKSFVKPSKRGEKRETASISAGTLGTFCDRRGEVPCSRGEIGPLGDCRKGKFKC